MYNQSRKESLGVFCGSHGAYGSWAFVGVCFWSYHAPSKMARKPRSLLQYNDFSFHFSTLDSHPDSFSGLLTGGLAIVHMQIGMKWVVCPATLPGQLAAGNTPAGSCQQEGLSVFVILRTHTWEFFLTFALHFSFRPLPPALPPLWLTSTNLHLSSAHLRSFSQRLSLMAFCLLIPPRALCRL